VTATVDGSELAGSAGRVRPVHRESAPSARVDAAPTPSVRHVYQAHRTLTSPAMSNLVCDALNAVNTPSLNAIVPSDMTPSADDVVKVSIAL